MCVLALELFVFMKKIRAFKYAPVLSLHLSFLVVPCLQALCRRQLSGTVDTRLGLRESRRQVQIQPWILNNCGILGKLVSCCLPQFPQLKNGNINSTYLTRLAKNRNLIYAYFLPSSQHL